MYIWFNGKLVPNNKAKIDLYDRGFMYGDGVFESLRTYNGKPFKLDEHLDRLLHAANILSIKAPNVKTIKNAVIKTIKANRFNESYIKIIITRGIAKSHGMDINNVPGKPTMIVLVNEQKDYPKETFLNGWSAIITRVKRGDTLSNIKTLNYANNVLAKIEASQKKAKEAFMLTIKGYLTEGTVSNLFFVKNNIVYTPSVKTGILHGITRNTVIMIAKRNKIKTIEGSFIKDKLYSADECFITFSGAGIVPIVKIDGKKINKGKVGPITNKLINLYEKETRTI